jgi:PAS domain S-box-containing protein
MTPDTGGGFAAVSGDQSTDAGIPESASIYPLIHDSGNQRVLIEWLDAHESYEAVDSKTNLSEAEFDICIVDEGGLRENRDTLKRIKAEAQPVLLPVLLLFAEASEDLIKTDQGDIADNAFPARVDEIVSLPIRQTELEWRIQALLRLRSQSITSQRQTESLRLFKQALESSGNAMFLTDPDGTIKYVNPAFEEITGYTREEAVGSTPRILNSGEMSDSFFAALWNTILSGEVWNEEITNRRADGELYTAKQTIAPVTQDGEIQAYVAVQTDITESNERKETLRRRTRAIDEAPIGISISDPKQEDNPLIYVNDAFVDLTGYPREEALGKNCRYLQGENTDPDRVARIREAIDAEEPISVEIRNYRKDGTEFWNHLEIAPVRDEAGNVVNYIGFQQDITGRRERHRQLRILDRVLRHNLRNNMSVIQSQADGIRSKASGAVAASAGKIIDKSERVISMAEKERKITDLLQERPTLEEITVSDLFGQVVSNVKADHPDAEITAECSEHVTARATIQFGQALTELLTNAVVHNDSKSPEVTVTVTQNGDSVCIEIADDGPLIPEMERSLLQDEAEETPLYHGSGLGLWLVKLITSRSGGTITFEQNSPEGNVVTIELPSSGSAGAQDTAA